MLRLVQTAMAAVLIGAIAACSAGLEASPSGASAATSLPATASCPTVDLRTPSGAHIDLTGTWHGNDNAYYSFLQIGNCVWATGTSSGYALTLRGTVMSDFSVPFEYAIVACRNTPQTGAACATHYGSATFAIAVEDPGSDIVLERMANTAEVVPASGLGVTEWSRVSETPLFPLPTPGS